MKFIEVNELPKPANGSKRGEYHRYDDELTAFMRMNVKMARVEWSEGEFDRPYIANKCLHYAIKRRALPIDTYIRGDEVYLVRRDI